jgi:hypothetical protein
MNSAIWFDMSIVKCIYNSRPKREPAVKREVGSLQENILFFLMDVTSEIAANVASVNGP